jgi:hypothetical protein
MRKNPRVSGQFEERVTHAAASGILAFWQTTLKHRRKSPENRKQIDRLSAKGYTRNYGGVLLCRWGNGRWRGGLARRGRPRTRMSEPARGPAHRITSFVRVSGLATLAVGPGAVPKCIPLINWTGRVIGVRNTRRSPRRCPSTKRPARIPAVFPCANLAVRKELPA